MPVIQHVDYKPPILFRNNHLNTIYPFLFRNGIVPDYKRKRFDTGDGDFIDLDTIFNSNNKLAILCHGLEGSSDSQYMRFTSQLLSENGWDVIAMNHRSCSGEMNRKIQMYHSGFTDDLHEVISTYEKDYEEVILAGFSLGGNMILKYTNDGLFTLSPILTKVAAVSVPCDLAGCSEAISHWSNKVYDVRFLKTLLEKMVKKHEQFPDVVKKSDIEKVKTLKDFDEYFTGPLHGFSGAQEYYDRCNSLQFLGNVRIPTLLINAQDDPFLSQESLPFEIANDSENLFFLSPKHGGHVGFSSWSKSYYWHERKILEFVNEQVSFSI